MTTAKIIVNAVTHRSACTDNLGPEDLAAYDETAPAFFADLGNMARAAGFDFEIDTCGQGSGSYRVEGQLSYDELTDAHEFMQSEVADFWGKF